MLNRLVYLLNTFKNIELIIFLLSCAIVKIYGPPLFGDPDVGWHIAAGSYIRSIGHIPEYDPWAYSYGGQVWYNLSWLWDVFISVLYEYIGLQGLYNFAGVMNALFLIFLFRELKRTYNIRYDEPALAVVALSGIIFFESFYLRPQLASYFLALLFMKLLEKYKSRKFGLTCLYTFLITIVWCNIHGSFILIWIIGLAYLIEAGIEKRIGDIKFLLFLGVLAFIASFINPWGFDIYRGVMRTLDTAIKPYIAEWKPFTFGHQYGSSLIVMFLFIGGFINNKARVSHKVMAVFGLLNGLTSIRGWQTFAILGAPFFSRLFNELYLKQRPLEIKVLKQYGQTAFGIFSFVLAIYGFSVTKALYRNTVPIDEINFIINNYKGCHLYNEYDNGGHIIFQGNGKVKHFMDGRAGTAFSESTIRKYVAFIKDDETWSALYEAFPFDVALVSKKAFSNIKTSDFFDEWHMVFEGDVARVYAKQPLKLRPVIIDN